VTSALSTTEHCPTSGANSPNEPGKNRAPLSSYFSRPTNRPRASIRTPHPLTNKTDGTSDCRRSTASTMGGSWRAGSLSPGYYSQGCTFFRTLPSNGDFSSPKPLQREGRTSFRPSTYRFKNHKKTTSQSRPLTGVGGVICTIKNLTWSWFFWDLLWTPEFLKPTKKQPNTQEVKENVEGYSGRHANRRSGHGSCRARGYGNSTSVKPGSFITHYTSLTPTQNRENKAKD